MLLVILSSCCIPLGTPEPPEESAVEIRGLAFRKPVPVRPSDGDSMIRALTQDLDREVSAAKWQSIETAWEALGLLREGTDLRDTYVRLMDDEVIGYYDPRSGDLAVDAGADTYDGIVVHELAHALADQHFGLEGLRRAAGDNDDTVAALDALIEGDATYVMAASMFGGPGFERYPGMDRRMRELAESATFAKSLPNLPPIVGDRMMFSYMAGLNFVSQGRIRGGWNHVNAAWKRPPVSTEQILHPERFFDRYDEPTEIALPDLSVTLGRGWKRGYANTLGELGIRSLLATFGETFPDRYADGWDGDAYAAYANKSTGETLVAWASVWDSERDAADFYRAMQRAIRSRGKPDNGSSVFIARDGTTVSYAYGIPRDARSRVERALEPTRIR